MDEMMMVTFLCLYSSSKSSLVLYDVCSGGVLNNNK